MPPCQKRNTSAVRRASVERFDDHSTPRDIEFSIRERRRRLSNSTDELLRSQNIAGPSARHRSRSRPRSASTVAAERRAAPVARNSNLFWSLLGPILATLVLFFVILANDSVWRESACEYAALRSTSNVVNRVTDFELCDTSSEERISFDHTSPGLAAILRGQELAQTAQDLILSFHGLRLYTKVLEKVRDDTGYKANELGSLGVRAQGKSMGHAMEGVYHAINAFYNTQQAFEREVKDGIDLGVGYIHFLGIKFDNLATDAEESSIWHDLVDPWFYGSWLGRFWYERSAPTSLTFALVKAGADLFGQIARGDHSIDKLLDSLSQTTPKLGEAEERLRTEENSVARECHQAHQKILKTSSLKYAYLADWKPFQPHAACETGVLDERCCSSVPEYAEWAEGQVKKLKEDAVKVTAVRKSLAKVGESLRLLQKTARQGGRLNFWPSEKETRVREAARLQDRFAAIAKRWRTVLRREEDALPGVEQEFEEVQTA